jgi:hypothetical protein
MLISTHCVNRIAGVGAKEREKDEQTASGVTGDGAITRSSPMARRGSQIKRGAYHVEPRPNHATPRRVARRVACRTQGASQEREGTHPHARSRRCRATRAALGEGREGVCFRYARGQKDARRALRRLQPIDRLSFHVAMGFGPRLRQLLLLRRPRGRRQYSPRQSRRYVRGDFARSNSPTSKLTGSGWDGALD